MLVDNGSTDHTPDLCQALQSEVPDSIVVVQEPERGYVPARHRGNRTAAHVARSRGIPGAGLVIIQADADTLYSQQYVDIVREAISTAGVASPVGQAITEHPPELRAGYPNVFAEVDLIDQTVQRRFGSSRLDALIDDKACAYMLGDYERWGGHRREYLRDGTELLAETTRLTIAGLAQGARRIEIAGASRPIRNAGCWPMRRKSWQRPASHTETAGFSRITTPRPWAIWNRWSGQAIEGFWI